MDKIKYNKNEYFVLKYSTRVIKEEKKILLYVSKSVIYKLLG